MTWFTRQELKYKSSDKLGQIKSDIKQPAQDEEAPQDVQSGSALSRLRNWALGSESQKASDSNSIIVAEIISSLSSGVMVAGRLHKTTVCVRMPTLLWSTLALKGNLTWCLCFIVIDSMSLWVIVVIDNQLFQLILHRHGKVHRPAVPRARPEADQVLPWQGVHDSTSLELAQFRGLLVWHEMFLSNCLALSCCCFASNVCFGL